MYRKIPTEVLLGLSSTLAILGFVGVRNGGGWIAWICLLFFGCVAPAFAYRLLRELGVVPNRLSPHGLPSHRVSVSEAGVVSHHPNGTEERVAWDALETVGLRAEDAYRVGWIDWILIGKDETGCVVPSDAEGCDTLLAAMQSRLPGFENEAVIEAMGMLEGGKMIWKRDGAS